VSKRLDAVLPRKYKGRDGSEKTNWLKIGVAFETKTGGYRVTLEALPLQQMNQDGTALECTFLLMEPREDSRGDKPSGGSRQKSNEPDYGPGDIPF
jgi:hypothetical protein